MSEPSWVSPLVGWSWPTFFNWYLILWVAIGGTWNFVKHYDRSGPMRHRQLHTAWVSALIAIPAVLLWVPLVNLAVRVLWGGP